ncbi:conserved hypothetical protein [Gloeothece citriformis PCC 7424]|uniref:Conjugation TrbI family protein n=1 Tax=Gloeothece citriformis (strain PCC 7424) TaxID=65393 RepID=B7KGY4_GLOC7|nr:TrbI/VirB10 family protein [Gloeothece citriformis]ACK73471.1 conserved hypothetical protein [Gloeothece citriformis PCC 7424]
MNSHLNGFKNVSEDLNNNEQVNSSPPINESLEWESRMAQLVGLEIETIAQEQVFEDNSLVLDSLSSQSQDEQIPSSFSSNPFMKLGIVGATTLIIFILAGGFLYQIMNLGHQTPKKKPLPPVTPPENTESRLQNLETEIETLKTQLAFSEQENAIKLAQKTLRTRKQTQVSSTPSSTSIPPSKNPTPAQIKTVYVPKIVTVEKIVKVPQPVPQSSPKPPSPPLPPPQNKVNPSPSPPLPPPVSPPQTRVNQPVRPPVPVSNPNPVPASPQTPSIPRTTPVQHSSPQSPKTLPVGTSAQAVLATAVFGESSRPNNSDQEANVFVVILQEPLKTSDGEVALPPDTQVLTKISSLNDKGLLYLSGTKVIWENNGNLVEKPLPQGSIGIRSGKGKPLLAKKFPSHSGSIATMDMSLFVLGGLGKVAQLFNRTESEVVTTNVGGTVITNNNNAPNMAAGALEGGLTSVIPQITQRNQQAMAEMLQRTNIWFLPAGTEVEIYINQPLQF